MLVRLAIAVLTRVIGSRAIYLFERNNFGPAGRSLDRSTDKHGKQHAQRC